MKTHMRRTHQDTYQQYYGVPCPPRAPCTEPGCDQTFSTTGESPTTSSRCMESRTHIN